MVDESVNTADLLADIDYPDNFELVDVLEDDSEYGEYNARVISSPQGPGDGENSKTFHGPGGATPGRMVLRKQLASYYSISRKLSKNYMTVRDYIYSSNCLLSYGNQV